MILQRCAKLTLFAFLSISMILLSGCGSQGSTGNNAGAKDVSKPDLAEILVKECDLDELLSSGLPVILNFGDDSRESKETVDVLMTLYEEIKEHVIIRSIDLAQNPSGKAGFPIQIIPTQFFYDASGAPIPLPVNIGVILSAFMSVETEEPVFTAHEGPLTLEEFINILAVMGIVSIEALS